MGEFIPQRGARIKKISWWHNAIIDWMIANPDAKLGECAQYFDVTAGWLSSIVNSDLFRAAFQERLEDHRAVLSTGIAEKIDGLTHLCLEEFEQRIQEERDRISNSELNNMTETVLKAAGYLNRSNGAITINPGDGPTQINNHVHITTLERAQEKYRESTQQLSEKPREPSLEDQSTSKSEETTVDHEPIHALQAPS